MKAFVGQLADGRDVRAFLAGLDRTEATRVSS